MSPQRKTRKRPPGRPVASGGSDTRELLLHAAVELFAEHGIAGTTFSMIAKRAGLTPAMMHYYFKGRDELLDAVVDEQISPLIAAVWNPVEPGESPAEMVRGVVRRLLEGIQSMPWIPSAWIREVLSERGLLRSRVMRHIPRDKVQTFCIATARAQEAQVANPDLEPLLLVFSMLGLVMLQSATLRTIDQIFQRGAISPQTLERHITGLLLHGLDYRTGVQARSAPKRIRRSHDA